MSYADTLNRPCKLAHMSTQEISAKYHSKRGLKKPGMNANGMTTRSKQDRIVIQDVPGEVIYFHLCENSKGGANTSWCGKKLQKIKCASEEVMLLTLHYSTILMHSGQAAE